MSNTAKHSTQIREKTGQRSLPLTLENTAIAAFILVSVGVYILSVQNINLQQMTDVGLVSVLPWTMYVSMICLCAAFFLTLRQKALNQPLLLLEVVLLIVMLYGVTVPIEETPRFNVTWRHAGLVEYVQRNQIIQPSRDAYLNWPGFFILSAFVTEAAGLKSILDLAAYASVFNNLLYLGALLMIFRSTTQNRRLAWFAIWLFFITNWIAQDYYSPQGLNFFIYLTILGILLTWFQDVPGKRLLGFLSRPRFLRFLADFPAPASPAPDLLSGPSLMIVVCLLLLTAFSVSSHQLTQFAILFCATALTLFQFNSFRSYPMIVALLIAVWMIAMATVFLKGNINSMLLDIGHIEEAFHQGVSQAHGRQPGAYFDRPFSIAVYDGGLGAGCRRDIPSFSQCL